MQKKRFSVLHLLLCFGAGVALTLGGCLIAGRLLLGSEGLSVLKGYLLIQERFVEDVDAEKLADGALHGMVESLGDRWSRYLNKDSYVNQQESRANSYVGIGCTVSFERAEGLLITKVQEGSGAAESGLQAGEVILSVDGASLAGEAGEARAIPRGEEGTRMELVVKGETGALRTVTVLRKKVEDDPVAYDLLGGVGYIKIDDFHSRCAEEAIAAVDDLMEQGAKALVFDVRGNPGGYVTQLTELLDYLMPEGDVFISRTRSGGEQVTQSDAHRVELPMAVLCDGDSYSAAEFFAGALQEAGLATVVGEQTCGKGYSQQTFALPSGGALSISTAAYFTGKGTSFIGIGVTPDVVVALSEEDSKAFAMERLDYGEDAQLQAALALFT